jgi:hypothetical protein
MSPRNVDPDRQVVATKIFLLMGVEADVL